MTLKIANQLKILIQLICNKYQLNLSLNINLSPVVIYKFTNLSWQVDRQSP